MLYLKMAEGPKFGFNLFDLAIDAQIYMNIVATGLYIAYVSQFGFRLNEFLEGSLTAVFFILGDVFRSLAFRYGPGGPINALVGTQVVYQTLLNALLFDQSLGAFQWYGITAGIIATIIISAGDEIVDLFRGQKKTQTEETSDKLISNEA